MDDVHRNRRGFLWTPLWIALAVISALVGCDEPASVEPPVEVWRANMSIEEVAAVTCDTPLELVDGLSRQLVDAINCLRPGTLDEIPLDGGIEMLREGRPNFIDARGLADLLGAASDRDAPMVIRWAYRDVALQHLFWLQDLLQGCAVAAPAGLSNHQNGLAVDLNDWRAWEPIMARHGWLNALPNDRVHFDYQNAEDVGLGALSLLAFQALWNKNHPNDLVPLTGEMDEDTDRVLGQAPIDGFPSDLCEGGPPPIGPGPVRGPSVAQSAWRGCEAPVALIEGLSEQLVEAMQCLEPNTLVGLQLCEGAGCLQIEAPPIVEALDPTSLDALLAASVAADRPIVLKSAFRDVALQRFYSEANNNIGCPLALRVGRSAFTSGHAIEIRRSPAVESALNEAGFSNEGTDGRAVYLRGAGTDRSTLAIRAFQELWNLNRQDDPVDTDGAIGPQTRSALDRAPIAGFPNSLCGNSPQPDAGLSPDRGIAQDLGLPIDLGIEPDDGVESDQGELAPDEGAAPDIQPHDDVDSRLNDGSMADGAVTHIKPPISGWTGLATEETGCQQTPSTPLLWTGFILFLGFHRRRRN